MMLNTTDEINLHRLLISCEDKLKVQPIDVWTATEKRKFATVNKNAYWYNSIMKLTFIQ
jgi:hypothetical protein